jgi:hypothetical protein
MMTILKNRSDLSQSLDDEIQNPQGSRKHVSVAIIAEIIKARQKGWDSARISKEYNVDPSVIKKLDGTIAIPIINSDGVVCYYTKQELMILECVATEMSKYIHNPGYPGKYLSIDNERPQNPTPLLIQPVRNDTNLFQK